MPEIPRLRTCGSTRRSGECVIDRSGEFVYSFLLFWGQLMTETMAFVPILLTFVIALVLAVSLAFAPRLLVKRRPTPEKMIPYECGKDPIGSARERFSIAFYLVAMIFILFDIEAIFLIPWGVVFRDLAREISGGFVFVEMMIFMAVVIAGYIYAWKKGVFDWNR